MRKITKILNGMRLVSNGGFLYAFGRWSPPRPPFFSIYNFNIQNNISPLFLVLTFNCESVTLFFFLLKLYSI